MSALAPLPRTSSTTFGVRLPSVPALDGGIAAAGGCSDWYPEPGAGRGGQPAKEMLTGGQVASRRQTLKTGSLNPKQWCPHWVRLSLSSLLNVSFLPSSPSHVHSKLSA